MELKYVIPNMEKTFGNLEYAGEGKVEQKRINGRMTTLSRNYNLLNIASKLSHFCGVLSQSMRRIEPPSADRRASKLNK